MENSFQLSVLRNCFICLSYGMINRHDFTVNVFPVWLFADCPHIIVNRIIQLSERLEDSTNADECLSIFTLQLITPFVNPGHIDVMQKLAPVKMNCTIPVFDLGLVAFGITTMIAFFKASNIIM